MPDGSGQGAGRLRSVPVEIRVSVGHARPTIAELLSLKSDQVLPLDRRIEDPVELFVGDRLVAYGELVQADTPKEGGLAVRITGMVDAGEG